MRCAQVRKRLSPYMDGELSGRQKSFIEGHLGQCPLCHQALEDLRHLEAVRRTELDREPAQSYWDAFLPRLRRRMAATSRPSLEQRRRSLLPALPASPWLRAAGAVASVALVFFIGRAVMQNTGMEQMRPVQDKKPMNGPMEQSQTEMKRSEEKQKAAAPRRKETTGGEKEVVHQQTEWQSVPPASATGAPPPSVEKDESRKIALSAQTEEPPQQMPMAREHLARQPMVVTIDEDLTAYKKALRHQQQGESDSAAIRFLDIVHSYPQSPAADNAQYQLNLIDNSSEKQTQNPDGWRRQRDSWQNFMQLYPQSELAEDACLKLADSWYHLALLTTNREDLSQALAANRQCQRTQKVYTTLHNQARELEELLSRQRR